MIIISKYPNRAPYIINVPNQGPSFEQLITPDTIVEIDTLRGSITFNTKNSLLIIDYSSAPIYEQHVKKVPLKPQIKDRVKDALSFIELLSTTLKQKWYNEYTDIKNIITKSRLEALPNLLIGRGSGFTPAGDDVLQGIITSFKLAKIEDTQILKKYSESLKVFYAELKHVINNKKTTWASASYITYAMNGHYDEEALSVLHSVTSRNEDYIEKIAMLARRGHNSGLFISLGLMWGVYYMLKTIKSM